MTVIKYLIFIVIAAITSGAIYVYSGVYPIGADVPHNKFTYWFLETVRDSSIEKASKNINVPPLDNPELLLSGGADYNDMCVSCHLAPGMKQSDMSVGLYPRPPKLTAKADDHAAHGHANNDVEQSIRRQFWIIKHGIKASGMPAWGPTHSDERIWAMVAFLQKLPELSPEQYQILTARDEAEATSQH